MQDERRIYFRSRPKAIPGDMRIAWRLSVTQLALFYSNGKKASLAKLHIMNNAVLNPDLQRHLREVVEKNASFGFWPIRVEPAFSRSLDFLVGEQLADWRVSSERSSLVLTPHGVEVAKILDADKDLLVEERVFLKSVAKSLTEAMTKRILSFGSEK